MILTNKKEQTRFLRFMAVGIFGAVIDFGTFNLLTVLFHFPFIIAQAISFTLAVCSNFIWNRYWTYPDSRSKPIPRQLVQFFGVNIIGLLIRTLLINWLDVVLRQASAAILPAGFLSPEIVGNNAALATAIIVVMLWNFIVNRYWTYNDVD
ncbi:MAG: GtrA family protein [Anaerolineaceae bacterium]|nr:GtrA family protein [Anaerolineaceae bacterium]